MFARPARASAGSYQNDTIYKKVFKRFAQLGCYRAFIDFQKLTSTMNIEYALYVLN